MLSGEYSNRPKPSTPATTLVRQPAPRVRPQLLHPVAAGRGVAAGPVQGARVADDRCNAGSSLAHVACPGYAQTLPTVIT